MSRPVLLQRIGQRGRIRAVDASSIIGDLAGARRKRDEHLAGAGFGICETLLQPLLLRDRTVAAGVQDEQFDADRVVLDDVDQLVELHGVGHDLFCRGSPHVDRQQQVLALMLNRMTGVIENSHVRAHKMRADRVFQILGRCFRDVIEQQHVEIELGKRGRDELGVVLGIGQRRKRVFAVSHHNRRAPLGLGAASEKQAECHEKRDKEDEGPCSCERRAC